MRNLLSIVFLLFFFQIAFAQEGWIWDKTKTCKIFTLSNVGTREFNYSEGTCKVGFLNGKSRVTLFEDAKLFATITGTFKEGYLEGKADVLYSDGEKYSGEFVKSRKTTGLIEYSNGDYYTGSFDSDGHLHGKGTYVSKNNTIYSGSFDHGLYHGWGTFTSRDGDKFTGTYEKGLPSGNCTVYFKNGDRFEGIFSKGQAGNGWMYYKDGSSAAGSLDSENKFQKKESQIELNDGDVVNKSTQPKSNSKFSSTSEAIAFLQKNFNTAFSTNFSYVHTMKYDINGIEFTSYKYNKETKVADGRTKSIKSLMWREIKEFEYSFFAYESLTIRSDAGPDFLPDNSKLRVNADYISKVYEIIEAVDYMKSR